jgi:hypothetical protein
MRLFLLVQTILVLSGNALAAPPEWKDFLGCYQVVLVDGEPANHRFQVRAEDAFYLLNHDGTEISVISFQIPRGQNGTHIHEIFVNQGTFSRVGNSLVHQVESSGLLYRAQPTEVKFAYQSHSILRAIDAETVSLTYSDRAASSPTGLTIHDEAQVILKRVMCNSR